MVSTYSVKRKGQRALSLHREKLVNRGERGKEAELLTLRCMIPGTPEVSLLNYLLTRDNKSPILFKLAWVRFLSLDPMRVLTNTSILKVLMGLHLIFLRLSPSGPSFCSKRSQACLWSQGQWSHIKHIPHAQPWSGLYMHRRQVYGLAPSLEFCSILVQFLTTVLWFMLLSLAW